MKKISQNPNNVERALETLYNGVSVHTSDTTTAYWVIKEFLNVVKEGVFCQDNVGVLLKKKE